MQLPAPTPEYVPAWHAVQVGAPGPANLPAAHFWQTELPAVENSPASQVEPQLLFPVPFSNFPASQSMHAAVLKSFGWNLPGLHGVQTPSLRFVGCVVIPSPALQSVVECPWQALALLSTGWNC